MAFYKSIFVFLAIFCISNAFYVQTNTQLADGATIGEHFLNEKFNFLENKFKNTPIDFDAIKEKIEAQKQAENTEESTVGENEATTTNNFFQQKLSFLQNKLRPKFDLIKQEIETKRQAEGLESAPQIKEGSVGMKPFGAGAYFFNQKLGFLENKFKNIPSNEFGTTTDNRDETLKEKLTFLLDFLKQLQTERLNADHQITKRSIKDMEEWTNKDAVIGTNFLNEKLTFLQNKFKGTLVDFNAIKEKIAAKKKANELEVINNASNQHKISKRNILMEFPNGIIDGFLNGIFEALNSVLKSIVDVILVNINIATNGILNASLSPIQSFFYSVIDESFPIQNASFTL